MEGVVWCWGIRGCWESGGKEGRVRGGVLRVSVICVFELGVKVVLVVFGGISGEWMLVLF